MIFHDRCDAGKKLAEKLRRYHNTKNTIVIGLPRGGIIVAYEIAHILNLPLDVITPRKISAPHQPELALGAIMEDESTFFDTHLIALLHVSKEYLEQEKKKEQHEALRRTKLYRKNKPPLTVANKTVILVDDGIATGATIKAAFAWLKKQNPKNIIIAVPVAPQSIYDELCKKVEHVICLYIPPDFGAVGNFYRNFQQTTDEEVITLLSKSKSS